MSSQYYDRIYYHMTNEISKFIPWAMKIGEPNFPPKLLWQVPSSLGSLNFVEMYCNSTNQITSVKAKDSLSKVIEVAYTYDGSLQKVTLTHKYDGNTELTITEEIKSNNDLEVKLTVPGVSTNDVTILVKYPYLPRHPHGYFDVEITLGTAHYDGKLTPYVETVPTFVNDFAAAISAKTAQSVRALAHEMLIPLGNMVYSWDLGGGETQPPPMGQYTVLASAAAILLSDLGGGSFGTFMADLALHRAYRGNIW